MRTEVDSPLDGVGLSAPQAAGPGLPFEMQTTGLQAVSPQRLPSQWKPQPQDNDPAPGQRTEK